MTILNRDPNGEPPSKLDIVLRALLMVAIGYAGVAEGHKFFQLFE